MSKIVISEKELNDIEKLLNEKAEYCGSIENGKLVYQNKGEDTGRASCMNKYYSTVIWHTHPHSSKGYPSGEDIIKVSKNNKVIKLSIIFTSWGIWEIRGGNTFELDKLTEFGDRIYFSTEKGRLFKFFSIRDYLKNVKVCKFTPWCNIIREYAFEI